MSKDSPSYSSLTQDLEVKEEKRERGVRIRIGPPRLTRFEKARIVGARALQLSLGAPPLILIDNDSVRDTIEIAVRELESKALPISIRRSLPNGDYQDIPVSDLLD